MILATGCLVSLMPCSCEWIIARRLLIQDDCNVSVVQVLYLHQILAPLAAFPCRVLNKIVHGFTIDSIVPDPCHIFSFILSSAKRNST